MIRTAILALAFASAAAVVHAEDAAKPLTVEQCLNLLNGLNSLNCVGQQLNGVCDPAAKQYKLGQARVPIALNISALSPVRDGVQKEAQAFASSLPPLPAVEPGKPDSPERIDMAAKQSKDIQTHWLKVIAGPCPVTPGRIKATDLNIGDEADKNAITPSVLAAIAPDVDGLKP
jgi:hypothetical protein